MLTHEWMVLWLFMHTFVLSAWILLNAANSPVKHRFATNILQLQKYSLIFIYLLQCDLTLDENVYCSSPFSRTNVRQICVFLPGDITVFLWHVPAFSIRGKVKLRSLKIGWLWLTGSQKKNFSLLISPEPLEGIIFSSDVKYFFSKPSYFSY